MVQKIRHIIILILLGFLITNCSIDSKKQELNDSDLIELSFADSLWIGFRNALQNRQIDYLIDNPFDSIKCVDYIADSNKTAEIYKSSFIYSHYLKELMHLDTLSNFDFTTDQIDSMIYVNYTIKWRYAEEGAYNLIYMFKKDNDKYLFSGMITTL